MTAVWMTARGAGLSALLLLSITTAIGVVVSGRGRATTRVVVQYVHRVAASLGLGVLLLHIGTILADSYAHVGVRGAVVPFTSSFRATWVGLGTIAAYTFLAVAALGFARGRMAGSTRGAAIWRAVHMSSYAGWAIAMVHGVYSGTDTSVPWVRWLYVICGGLVVGALAARLADGRRTDLVRGAAAYRSAPPSRSAPVRIPQETSR